MNHINLSIKVPGKLMIAGEYAILSTGYPSIVIAIDRYITIKINKSNIFKLTNHSSQLPEVTWRVDQDGAVMDLDGKEHSILKDNSFLMEAIRITNQYLIEKEISICPFHLQIQNGLNDFITGKKYGLGSSAAIVVGVVSAILGFHNQGIEEERLKLYKLSCIAHLKAQGNGSGADIAASVYGGWLCYYRYDLTWLMDKLNDKNVSIVRLINIPWPNLTIEKIVPPTNIRLMAGWTKHTAKTSPLVNKMEVFQKKNVKLYDVFLELSKTAVEEFIKSCQMGHGAGILKSIQYSRTALQYLSDITGIQLETKEIRTLCYIADKYGRGKFSGAGGGDCGIAILMKGDGLDALKLEWEQAGIIPLDLHVSEQGVVRADGILIS